MGRRRDKLHARRGVAHPAYVLVHLVTRKLPALAGFGSLRHLDLKVLRVGEVVDRDPEAPRCYLLDRAVAVISVRVRGISVPVFAALARVGAGVDSVHRDRQGLVRLAANRPQRNRSCREPLDYLRRRLHLVK